MRRLSPNAIKNVAPHYLDSPKGIDMVSCALQYKFELDLIWLEKSFGRAVLRAEKRDNQDYLFPACFVGEGYDYLDMLAIDNYDAYSFSFARDPEAVEEYQESISNTYSRLLSVIFWWNMERINYNLQTDQNEGLKQEVKKAITTCTYQPSVDGGQVIGVEIENIYDQPDQVFQDFSFDHIETQSLYYPFGGIRVDLNCYFVEDC